VAVMAECAYALANHGDNMVRLHPNASLARRMLAALKKKHWKSNVFKPNLQAILKFGEKLAREPQKMTQDDIETLRNAGFDDGEISQIVQVAANFAYWVRVINGFGIKLNNDKIRKYS